MAGSAVVIAPRFPAFGNNGGEFSSGLIPVDSAEANYLGQDEKVAIAKSFDAARDFSNGLAAVLDKSSKKWDFIDTKGALAIPPAFISYPQSFSEGLAAIEEKGAVGYVDTSGRFVIPKQFFIGEAFRGGMAREVVEGPCRHMGGGPCGLFNSSIMPRIAKTFGQPPDCKVSFVNKSGIVLQQRFDDAEPLFEGLAKVSKYPAYGYIDRDGTLVIPQKFKRADDFHDGRAPVSLDGKTYFYIDRSGARAIAGNYRNASVFFKGLAHVEYTDGNFAYIRPSGERVFLYSSK